jgi:GAF domain-containing protein
VELDETVPIRGRQLWTAPARTDAATQLRARLAAETSLVDLARAGATYLQELFTARTVTVSTVQGGQYEDLISVGYLPPREQFYPATSTYPASLFPLAAKELQLHGGYFTSDLEDPKYKELVGSREDTGVASVMGVAIVTAGELRGEIFCTRGWQQAAFDRDDLNLARDLATPFGSRLVAALDQS